MNLKYFHIGEFINGFFESYTALCTDRTCLYAQIGYKSLTVQQFRHFLTGHITTGILVSYKTSVGYITVYSGVDQWC